MVGIIDTHLLIASRNTTSFPLSPGCSESELEGVTGRREVTALLDAKAMEGAVLVQRGRQYGFDNSLILAAASADQRLRAICAVDGRHEDCGAISRDLLSRPGVIGLRLMEPERDAGFDWLAGPGALAAWRAVADAEAVLDVHLFPWNRAAGLGVLEKLLSEFTGLRVAIDNLGNPALDDGPPDYGFDAALKKVAERKNVTLKVSAMSFARTRKAGLECSAMLKSMVAVFGANRLCWGSDVLAEGVTLESAIAEAREAASVLSDKDAAMVLSSTARELFGFDNG